MTGKPFAVLDRDGTIVVEKHYLADPDQLELLPGAAAGLAELRRLGLGLLVVTNQSAVGRGLLDESALSRIHERLTRAARRAGCDPRRHPPLPAHAR